MSQKSNINSPFVRPVDRESYSVSVGDTHYVDRKIYMEFVQTGLDENGKAIGSIQPVVKETKTDINKLINSHAAEVGLKNLISLYVRTGDASLFNQKRSINSMSGNGYVDLTSIPEKSASEIYSDIPEALKGNRSLEAFLKTLTKEQFEAFIKSLQESTTKKEEVKADE